MSFIKKIYLHDTTLSHPINVPTIKVKTEAYCERNVSDMQSQPDVGLFSPKILGLIARPRDPKKQRGWRWFDLLMARTSHAKNCYTV